MKWFLPLLLALFPLAAHCGWIDPSGKPIADTESRRSAGDFAVQILITPDEARFRQTWNTSKTPPKLSTTNTVRRGGKVSALLVFHGCAPNAGGICDAVADFLVEGPDGSRTPAGSGPLWSGKAMQQRLLQVGQTGVTLGFDKTDPMGEYKVTANVKDRVSGRALSVMARVKLAN
jgi:hypothetical protein